MQLEKIRDKLPLLYERDDILPTMIQQRGDVERVSSPNMRLPLQIRSGGKAGFANMDGGDLGARMWNDLRRSASDAGIFPSCGGSLVDWAAAKAPFLQKEIPIVSNGH